MILCGQLPAVKRHCDACLNRRILPIAVAGCLVDGLITTYFCIVMASDN